MAYDEDLAERINLILEDMNLPNLIEKRMFGGVGFMLSGNMACGVYQQYLIVRVGPHAYQDALAKPGSKVFDITGRPMTGWVMVSGSAIADDGSLQEWVEQGVEFAKSLPQNKGVLG